MKFACFVPVLLMLFGAFAPAAAHHSAAQFDFDNPSTIEGVVREIRVANPHTRIVLEVTDDSGTRLIEYEGHSRNNIYRRGWRPGMVEVGDRVTIEFATPRAGGDGGYITAVTTEDGDTF